MSPDEASRRQKFELSQIHKELAVVRRLVGAGGRLGRDEIQIRAAAVSLHSIYNGVERILELAAAARNVVPPKGAQSHSELLTVARVNGVISESLEQELRPYLAFRHFFRHSYGFLIDDEQLNPLLGRIRPIITKLAVELQIKARGA